MTAGQRQSLGQALMTCEQLVGIFLAQERKEEVVIRAEGEGGGSGPQAKKLLLLWSSAMLHHCHKTQQCTLGQKPFKILHVQKCQKPDATGGKADVET